MDERTGGLQRLVKADRELDQKSKFRALLATNEKIQKSDKEKLGDIEVERMVGIGFGMAVSVAGMMKELPGEIVLFDINPEVVAGGRMVIESLKKADSFEGWIEDWGNREKMEELYQEIVTGDEVLAGWLGEGSLEFILDEIENSKLNGCVVIEVIKNKFKEFQKKAMEGNMGIWLGDIGNDEWLEEAVEGMGETGSAMIYLSNGVDHLVRSGRRVEEYNRSLDKLGGVAGKVWWMETLNSKEYVLELGEETPYCGISSSNWREPGNVFRKYQLEKEGEVEVRLGKARGLKVRGEKKVISDLPVVEVAGGDNWEFNVYEEESGLVVILQDELLKQNPMAERQEGADGEEMGVLKGEKIEIKLVDGRTIRLSRENKGFEGRAESLKVEIR